MKSVLTTLSGHEQVQLRAELELIKDSFSLVEFDDEEVDEKKGTSLNTMGVNEWCWGMSGLVHLSCLIPDEDGSEFERELVQALEGLSVTAAAEKLSKVAGYI